MFAGVNEGDVIIEVEGSTTIGLTHDAVLSLLANAGGQLHMLVKR
jgi:C-terminal processing protease CtpA/Prc